MKKTLLIALTVALTTALTASVISLPAFAVKTLDNYIYTSATPFKVELRKVQNAQCISGKTGKTLITLRLSNIVCNEYSKYNLKTSTSDTKYTLEDQSALKNNNDATRYLSELLEANENNLYFKQQGIGFYGAVIGELYIGNTNINKLLVEKGFCRPIE